jgi:fibronectin type 3 domain-containing protein
VASEAVKAVTKARPAAPQGVTANSGEVKKVSLSWQQNKESDISEYRIWQKTSADKFTLVASSSSPSYVNTGLSDGTLFTYVVTAVDRDGLESGTSRPAQATTVPAPSRATGTRPLFRNGVAGIAWGKNPESDVRVYSVYRKGFLGPQKLGETTETEFLYRGSDKVELFVTAVNKDGLESEPSAPVIVDAANNR